MLAHTFPVMSGSVAAFSLVTLAAPLALHRNDMLYVQLGLLLALVPLTGLAVRESWLAKQLECTRYKRACQAQQNAWQYTVVLATAHALSMLALVAHGIGVLTRATSLTMIASMGYSIVLLFPAAVATYPRIPRLPPPNSL